MTMIIFQISTGNLDYLMNDIGKPRTTDKFKIDKNPNHKSTSKHFFNDLNVPRSYYV